MAGFLRKLVGLLSTGSVLAHGGVQLLHGGRGLLQGAGLVLSAGRQILVALRNLRTGRGNAFRALAHPPHHLHQTGLHMWIW